MGGPSGFRWCRSFLAQPPATGFHPSGMGRRGIARSPKPEARGPGLPSLRNGSARYRPFPEAGGPGRGAGIPAGMRNGGTVWFPVVSLVPRSTTGYRLPSLRDGSARYRQFPRSRRHGAAELASLRDAEWGDRLVSGGVARSSLNHRLQASIPPGWVGAVSPVPRSRRPGARGAGLPSPPGWVGAVSPFPEAGGPGRRGFHPSGMGRLGIARSPKPEARGPGRGAAIPSGMGRRGIARSPKPEARAAGLASLPGCGTGGPSGFPVVSLVPRSTTGYRLPSLRDGSARYRPFPEAGGPGGGASIPPGWVGAVSPVPRSRRPGARGFHPSGMRNGGTVWFPVVSLVPRSTTGYRLPSLRDGSARYRRSPKPEARAAGLASLPGCGTGGPSGFPVVSLVPRSTTGYRLPSLRDGSARYRPFPEAGGPGRRGFHPSGMGRLGIARSPKPEARGPGRGAAIPSGMGRRGIARSLKPEARGPGLASLPGCGMGGPSGFRWCRSFLAQPPATGFHPSGMGRRGIARSPKPEARAAGLPSLRDGSARYRPFPEAGGPGRRGFHPSGMGRRGIAVPRSRRHGARGAGLPSPPGWVGAVSPVPRSRRLRLL
jgi:hypothetical protein